MVGEGIRRLGAFWRRKLGPLFGAIVRSNDSPRQIAAGVALGVFIAFTPTVGVQTILALIVATWLRVSRIPAAIMVYITNPVTILPIYTGCYVVGESIMRRCGMDVYSVKAFSKTFKEAAKAGGIESLRELVHALVYFGPRMAVALLVGCFAVAFVAALIAYPVTLRIVEGHHVVHAQKAARKLRKKSHDLEEAVSQDADNPEERSSASQVPETAKEPDDEPGDSNPGERMGSDRVDPPGAPNPAGDGRRAG